MEAIAKRTATRLERGGGVYLRSGWKQPSRHTPAAVRFDGGYEVDGDGCWIWTGDSSNGYGRLNLPDNGGYVYAHRYSYERFVGSIPDGCEVDHSCHTSECPGNECKHRKCVNPEHLQAITHAENVQRGSSPKMLLHVRGVCARGHPRSESVLRKGTNLVVYCKACRREKRAERSAWLAGHISIRPDDS